MSAQAQLLIETYEPSAFEIVESKQGTGKLVARGEFGRVDVPTQNGRIYSRRLMEREIGKLGDKLKARRVTGQLDHPGDGKSSLEKVSHVITDLWIEKDGRVMGEAEIINTPSGKTLRALIEAGIAVGVSSRGFGSTKPVVGEIEGDEVQEDFVLRTYDFVEDPAVKTAFPKVTMESVEEAQKEENLAEMFLAEFPEIAQDLQESAVRDAVEKAKSRVVNDLDKTVEVAESRVRKEMSEAFEKRLALSLLEVRDETSRSLREEFGNDPEIGAAKAVLSQIAEIVGAYRMHPDEAAVRDALRAKEIEIAERTRERDDALEVGERAALLLHVERRISGHPMSDTIRKLMANSKLESMEDADDKLQTIMEDLPEVESEPVGPSEEEVQLREDNATLRGELKLAQERVAMFDEKLKRAVELGQRVNSHLKEAESRAEAADERVGELERELHESKLSAYKAAKVVGLPNGRAMLSLLEDVNSEDAVDKIVSRHGVLAVGDGEMRDMRRRLQRGYGDSPEPLNERLVDKVERESNVNEFGMPFSEMMHLAGIPGR